MSDELLWPNYYDIVILPPPDVQEHAIALSKVLEPYGSRFVLGIERFIPHISLYHIPVSAERFETFAKTVQDVASGNSGGKLRLVSLEMPVLVTDKPDWLTALHQEIVGRTGEFLDRQYGVESTWHTDYLPRGLVEPARRYLQQFGSPLINEVFRPHITLTSFEDRDVLRSIPSIGFEPLTFDVGEISICELGPSHSCQRTIATYPLRGSIIGAL